MFINSRIKAFIYISPKDETISHHHLPDVNATFDVCPPSAEDALEIIPALCPAALSGPTS
jgi:hypothetical protein